MNCQKCAQPVHGFDGACGSCGHVPGVFPVKGVIGVLALGLVAMVALAIQGQLAKAYGSSRNFYSNHLERLPAPERSKAFVGLLKDNGEECASVTRYFFRGDLGTNAMWNVRCSDTGDWMILIADNSWTRVAACSKLNQAGTPCWTKL